jgi:WD40 repeat protein
MSAAFSHDSKLLASASDDKTVKIWDTATGILQQTLEGHNSWVILVAFSRGSKLLASASTNGTVKIWDTVAGTLQQTIICDSYITSLLFDISNSILITNIGRIKIDRTKPPTLSKSSQEGRGEGDSQGLSISGSWVTWNTQKFLWLPPDYRAITCNISQSGSTVAISCDSRKVFIIGFSLTILSTLR